MKFISWRLLAILFALMLAAPAVGRAQAFASLDQSFLSPDQAFTLKVSRETNGDLAFRWTIAAGHYLYRDHTVAAAPGAEDTLSLRLQPGEKKDDPGFGVVDIWRTAGQARLSAATLELAGAPASINITYQGCKEDSICYPPTTRTIAVPALPRAARQAVDGAAQPPAEPAAALALKAPPAPEAQPAPAASPVSEPEASLVAEAADAAPAPAVRLDQNPGFVDRLADQGGFAWVLLAFFGFGALLAFTPCVFPMYPILAGVIGRGVDGRGTRRGLVLSTAYVLGLATAFGLLGVAAAWSGQNLQMALQSVWAVGALSIIFLVLAASMFGGFELQLPSAWTSRLSRDTGTGRRSVGSAAGLGFASALIVGPCVTAPLAGALLYIAQTGDAGLGAAALFALGLGKGAPLIVFGTAGARFLPKAGAWMDRVKTLFGFIFLGMAWWLASRILPPTVVLALGAMFALAAAAALGLFSGPATSRPAGLARAAGLAVAAWGIMLLIGLSMGAADPWRPLAPLASRSAPGDAGLGAAPVPAAVVVDSAGLERAIQEAGARSRPAMIYFTADWCVICRQMDRDVFADDQVFAALQNVDLIKVDVTNNTPETRQLMETYGVAGPPTLIFLSAASEEPASTRLVGKTAVSKVLASLDSTQAAR
ncbi:protein-disulfide reductase DsbD [Brevundimonas naejangsanensis]|uniref:protein-disulfide reductase DsbD n=1 Tax=Brevundimonas naejangsanensis TaxID=588932 RepID=UPI00106A7CD9|nr:protein-disulfide reductase DsbD [Brevundimonas naejangsanensis]QBQ48593.1 protein-disulfide reductase DsbD [Brevundimonas naejangsanensis]